MLLTAIPQMDLNQIFNLLDRYESLGPIPGIVLSMLDSFLPVIPLFAIIVANAAAYGLWKGFILSWIGVCGGSITVFYLIRKFGHRLSSFIEKSFPKSRKLFDWIEKKGFTPLFLLTCFPFTPSSLVNIISGLTNIPSRIFIAATLLGKSVMIFLISFLGHDLAAMLQKPWKLAVAAAVVALLWYAGRWTERRYNA